MSAALIFANRISDSITRQVLLTLFCACMTFSVGTALAQSNQTGAEPAPPQKITLDLQDVDIRVLINTVAEVSGKNFIVDPRVKGKVSVVSGASLEPKELYNMFLAILEVHNFAAVESENVIKILPSNVVKQRPTPTLFAPSEQSNDEQITQIIQLKHAVVQDLVPIIRPLIPPTSHFAPHVPSNSVVLTDTAANIQRVLKIIRRIDIPDKRSNVHVVYLNKAQASELAATLTQLATSTADPKDAAAAGRVNIQPLDSINALVISAPDDQFDKIQALIDELDIARELAGDITVITLKHAKAEDLVSILSDVASSGGVEGGAGGDFSVQADESSNSLIIKASGSQLRSVQSVIEKLDKRRAQVFVETIIAEVSLDQAADLGVELNAGGPRTLGGAAAPIPDDGTPAPVAATVLGNLVDRSNPNQVLGTVSAASNPSGLNFSLIDFGRFNLDVIINALRTDTNSNILSTPTILTLDNEEAEIIVGQEVPFVTGQFNNGQNNQVTTDGDGVAQTTVGSSFQTIERRDVGILLKIRPQINDGDTIQLEVLQETSSIVPVAIAGASDLVTNRRSIETVINVDDGQIVALGGLISDDVVDTVQWVPFLGKLPIVGNLFRTKNKTAIKRNLMVFLKPRIIRSADELAKYSKTYYDEVRRDGQLSRLKSDQFLINNSDPSVLIEYEKSVGDDGLIGNEKRYKAAKSEKEPPRPLKHRLKGIFFGRDDIYDEDVDSDFRTEGELDDVELDSDAGIEVEELAPPAVELKPIDLSESIEPNDFESLEPAELLDSVIDPGQR